MSGYDDSYDFEFEYWLAEKHPDAKIKDRNELHAQFRREKKERGVSSSVSPNEDFVKIMEPSLIELAMSSLSQEETKEERVARIVRDALSVPWDLLVKEFKMSGISLLCDEAHLEDIEKKVKRARDILKEQVHDRSSKILALADMLDEETSHVWAEDIDQSFVNSLARRVMRLGEELSGLA